MPGRRGRLLFAYLVLNRGRPLLRDELLMAGWGQDAPAEARSALNVLLSKLRHGLGADRLKGRAEVELLLPQADLHRRRGGTRGRAPGGVLHRGRTLGVRLGSGRYRLPRRHQAVPRRASGSLDRRVAAQAGGGTAPRAGVPGRGQPRSQRPGAGAGRGARQIPYHACALPRNRPPLLMEALERRGNIAEALRAYERLRVLLREELGIAPSPALQAVHRRLLGERRRLEQLGLREDVLAGDACRPTRDARRPCGPAHFSRALLRHRPCMTYPHMQTILSAIAHLDPDRRDPPARLSVAQGRAAIPG